jgi:DNA-binding transcriptional ArsR family regulator
MAVVAKLEKASEAARKRTVEDAVNYALGHRVRVDILCYLNEASRSPSELSALLHLPLSKVEHHVKELLSSKSIELASVKEGGGNTREHFYRAVEIPFFTDEEMWEKPFEVRQEIYGLILQSSIAEALAAFRAGKVSNDRHVCMAWDWFSLDAEGRAAMAEENARSWRRRVEIEAESANRRAKTGEEGVTVIVSLLAHERARFLGKRSARGQLAITTEKPETQEDSDTLENPGSRENPFEK